MKDISDIAELAGVSKSIVLRFLNNGSVSPATKEKITKTIEENNYQPNQFARSLRARRTNLIGAIIPRMNSYAVDETIKGLVHQCNQHQYQLLSSYIGLKIDGETSALKTLSRSKVDGIVLMATHTTEAHIEAVEKIDVPVIIVGQEHDRLYSIYHDDYKVGHRIGVLIGEKDCRNVHFFGVSEEDIVAGIQRKLGVAQALKDYHISPKIYETTFKYEQAFKDVSQQLERIRDADVIVGVTDTTAFAIYKYCSDHQQRFYNRSIYGFGGDPMTQTVLPVIQTVSYNYFEAGKQALEEINQLLKGEQTTLKIKIPIKLN